MTSPVGLVNVRPDATPGSSIARAPLPASVVVQTRPDAKRAYPKRQPSIHHLEKRKAAMKTALAAAILTLVLATSAQAGTVTWTKAGAVSAVKAAPIWKGSAGVGGSYATMRATAVTVKPYGKTRRVNGKLQAAMWDVTATISFGGESTSERFCVKALGPLHGSATAFQVGGWAWHSPGGGCTHWAASGGGAFEWGGSKAVVTHP